jgi:hypothetical protein
MHRRIGCICAALLLGRAGAQTHQPVKTTPPSRALQPHAAPASTDPPEIEPILLTRATLDDKIVTLRLVHGIATSVRLPEPVNSIVLGDPEAFEAEHSEREPELVTVKPTGTRPAETNLLITTSSGHQANLLLVSRGEDVGGAQLVDVLLKYGRPAAGSFLVDETPVVSSIVAETRKLDLSSAEISRPAGQQLSVLQNASAEISPSAAGIVDALDKLLARQQKAPMPVLYGQHPVEPESGPRIEAGVSEVLDEGNQVAVLFSVFNPSSHAIEVLPPQVQLGGKLRKKWTTAEQLRVIDFRLSARKLAPGQRSDGVILFERPGFKQSNETLFLQIADAGAVDKPALAPIGFGISSVRGGSAYGSKR